MSVQKLFIFYFTFNVKIFYSSQFRVYAFRFMPLPITEIAKSWMSPNTHARAHTHTHTQSTEIASNTKIQYIELRL